MHAITHDKVEQAWRELMHDDMHAITHRYGVSSKWCGTHPGRVDTSWVAKYACIVDIDFDYNDNNER